MVLGVSSQAPFFVASAQEIPKVQQLEAMASASSLQAMIEHYFMTLGVYPESLEELEKEFDYGRPEGLRAMKLVQNPITQKPFLYAISKDQKSYQLVVELGIGEMAERVALGPVDWGWRRFEAEQNRFERMAFAARDSLKATAIQVEAYAKKNQGAYPENLDSLFPEFLSRYPVDPLSGKNLVYQLEGGQYTIEIPDPKNYGLKVFRYHSSQGIQIQKLKK